MTGTRSGNQSSRLVRPRSPWRGILKEFPIFLGLVAGIFFTRSVRLLYMEDSTNDLTQDHRMGMMIPSAFKEHSPQETQKRLDTNEKVDSMEKYNGSLSKLNLSRISYRNDTMRNTTTKELLKTTKVESKANATSEFLNSSSSKQREYRHYDVPWGTIREQFDSGTNLTAGQDYLDFAVVGFPKCGTSTMSKSSVPEKKK